MAQRRRRELGKPSSIANFPITLLIKIEDYVDGVRDDEISPIRSIEDFYNGASEWAVTNDLSNYLPPPLLRTPRDGQKVCTRIRRSTKKGLRQAVRRSRREGADIDLSKAIIYAANAYIELLTKK